MIVDSSALIAVLLKEPGYEDVLTKFTSADAVRVGAPTLIETSMVIVSRAGLIGKTLLARLLDEVDATVVEFTGAHHAEAVHAFITYGRSRHPAGLNFGDCLTYAVAKLSGEPLLCVSDNFSQTDLVLAT